MKPAIALLIGGLLVQASGNLVVGTEMIVNGVALTVVDNPPLPIFYEEAAFRPHTGIRIRPLDPTISGEKITVVTHDHNGYHTQVMRSAWNNSQLYVDFLVWCAPSDVLSITVEELRPPSATFTR